MIRSACIFLICIAASPVFAVDDITVLGLFRDKAMIEVDGRRYTLSAGESTDGGVKLIAADSRSAVLEVNGETRTLELGDHIGGIFKTTGPRHIVTIAPDRQGMYFVNGSINNYQVRFVVDTGASLISMNRNHARRLGLNYRLDGERSSASTASGIDEIYLVELDKVKVGEIELHDVRAAVHNGDFPQVILLGNSFLSKISLQRDGRLLELHQK